MADRDDVIERVRKMMERSVGRGCTAAEAETAAAMAARFMAEHNLTMAEVEEHETAVDDRWTTVDADIAPRLNLEAELAAGIVARYFFVRWYYQRRWDDVQARVVTALRFFGKPDNVETARWVYKALRAAFESLWTDYKVKTGTHHTERRLFVSGVARGFTDKMKAERAAMEVERSSDTFTAGKAAGARLNLSRPIGGGGAKGLPGN